MRDDGKKQLNLVNSKIKKAKNSLEALENTDALKTLQTEFVDIIPLGQFPEETVQEEDPD